MDFLVYLNQDSGHVEAFLGGNSKLEEPKSQKNRARNSAFNFAIIYIQVVRYLFQSTRLTGTANLTLECALSAIVYSVQGAV